MLEGESLPGLGLAAVVQESLDVLHGGGGGVGEGARLDGGVQDLEGVAVLAEGAAQLLRLCLPQSPRGFHAFQPRQLAAGSVGASGNG